jgi:hypothetical protein
VVVNQRASEIGEGVQQATLTASAGDVRLEATLTRAAGPGRWRFELPEALVEPGTLRGLEGKVETLAGSAIVFRLAGKPGERVSFVFRMAATRPGIRER